MASKTERTIINAAGLAPGVVLVPSRGRAAMADLIVIGYPDEATAYAAADEVRRLARDLVIQPDAIAVVARGIGRPRPAMVYQPMLELLGLLDASG